MNIILEPMQEFLINTSLEICTGFTGVTTKKYNETQTNHMDVLHIYERSLVRQ